MLLKFGLFDFDITSDKIKIVGFGNRKIKNGYNFVECQISGENKDTHLGVKMANSSEGGRLEYVSHILAENTLVITQRSKLIEAKTTFIKFNDTNAIRIFTEIKNISDGDIVVEEVSAFTLCGLCDNGIDDADRMYFTRFTQSHHAECQPRRFSFKESGLFRANTESQKRIAFCNIGSWSTKEELPQGIIENASDSDFLMFQIESNSSWYYEIADKKEEYYLYLGGANLPFGDWSKLLKRGETYKTVNVALSFGKSLNAVIGEMTRYRRNIAKKCNADKHLPVIFNEYMHLSWDSPTEENTKKLVPVVAKTGAEYYVIDCGWHNEENGNEVYPYVGQWKESKKRFPHGVRATTDYIRSYGMKAGLWIEPEIIGIHCKEMLDFYDADCFLQRNGRPIAIMGRYFLDFRAKKVTDYLSGTIRRMVKEYGADYIKMDYNQDCGVGTGYMAFCYGEGLEQCAAAYLQWVKSIQSEFPDVLFETCSSGGMRMDYKTLSEFPIVSTSDQTDYLKYPYIAGNVLSAVLPEQAAVWSYPVGVGEIGVPLPYDAEWVKNNITANRVAMNMINSFLGRMHLASHIELLPENQFALITEGVNYYKKIAEVKKRALPFFPEGFVGFGDESVVSGFVADGKYYVGVWNLSKNKSDIDINMIKLVRSVKIGYPEESDVEIHQKSDSIKVCLKSLSAVFLEVVCE